MRGDNMYHLDALVDSEAYRKASSKVEKDRLLLTHFQGKKLKILRDNFRSVALRELLPIGAILLNVSVFLAIYFSGKREKFENFFKGIFTFIFSKFFFVSPYTLMELEEIGEINRKAEEYVNKLGKTLGPDYSPGPLDMLAFSDYLAPRTTTQKSSVYERYSTA